MRAAMYVRGQDTWKIWFGHVLTHKTTWHWRNLKNPNNSHQIEVAAAPGWTIYPSSKRSPGSRDGRGMTAEQDLFFRSSVKLRLQFTDRIWYSRLSRPSKNETRVIRYSISTCPLAEFQHITWKGARQDYRLKNVWYVPPDKYIKVG